MGCLTLINGVLEEPLTASCGAGHAYSFGLKHLWNVQPEEGVKNNIVRMFVLSSLGENILKQQGLIQTCACLAYAAGYLTKKSYSGRMRLIWSYPG